jgi:hypothetical protein
VQQGRMSPRSTTSDKSKKSTSPRHHVDHQLMQSSVIPEEEPSSSTHATPGQKSPEGAGTDGEPAAKHAREEDSALERSAPPATIDKE